MALRWCPACQRPQTAQDSPACQYCGYAFAAPTTFASPTAGPVGGLVPGTNYTAYASPARLAAPGEGPVAPSRAGIGQPARLAGGGTVSPYTTSPERAIAITAAVAVLVLGAVAVLWWTFTHPNPAADAWLYHTVLASQRYAVVSPEPALKNAYTAFLFALTSVAPMVIVGTYWFSLRRLYQDRAPVVCGRTMGLSVGLLIALLGLAGVALWLSTDGDAAGPLAGAGALWALAMLAAYPALAIVCLLVVSACGGAGILFGRWFAILPLERIETLKSRPSADALLVAGFAGLGTGAQALVYRAFVGAPALASSPQGIWWVPAGALAVAAYACWSARRPVERAS